ncbi:hypothetical protein EBR66_01955 [bacterium]|nr:hypothetical protein [bacterium]
MTRVSREVIAQIPVSVFQRSSTPALLLLIAPSLQTRYTCVVSKKVARSAVARNRLKRWYREALRKTPLPARTLLVVHIRTHPRTFEECTANLHAALQKAFGIASMP